MLAELKFRGEDYFQILARSCMDHPTCRKRAKFSTRSAAAAALSAGLVIRVASSRGRARYCGTRIRRRSATSEFSVVVEKRRPEPTLQVVLRLVVEVADLGEAAIAKVCAGRYLQGIGQRLPNQHGASGDSA